MMATVAFSAFETAWLVRSLYKRKPTKSRSLHVWIDNAAALIGVLAEGLAGDQRSESAGRAVVIHSYATATTAAVEVPTWSAVLSSAGILGAGSFAASWLADHIFRTGHPPGAAVDTVLYLANSAPARIVVDGLKSQARRLDEARVGQLAAAERLAVEQEQQRQKRRLHDSVLQTLEAIARYDLNERLVIRQLDFEVAGLRKLLDRDVVGDTRSFDDRLQDLVQEFRSLGLSVDVTAPAPFPEPSYIASRALVDAAHEALMNVHKHSGVRHATIGITARESTLEVSIADAGLGFSEARAHKGFGITESIRARLAEIGGIANIDSSPGHGTRVTLRVAR